jgi:hypothetical protein
MGTGRSVTFEVGRAGLKPTTRYLKIEMPSGTRDIEKPPAPGKGVDFGVANDASTPRPKTAANAAEQSSLPSHPLAHVGHPTHCTLVRTRAARQNYDGDSQPATAVPRQLNIRGLPELHERGTTSGGKHPEPGVAGAGADSMQTACRQLGDAACVRAWACVPASRKGGKKDERRRMP